MAKWDVENMRVAKEELLCSVYHIVVSETAALSLVEERCYYAS